MHLPTTTTTSSLLLSLLLSSSSATPLIKPTVDLKPWKQAWEHKWSTNDWHADKNVFYFDATYAVKATPDQVRNGTTPVPGQPGAKGLFKYGVNVAENTICYNITLSGVSGTYSSPALTATHIHEAARGASGPPRIAFPNPQGPDERRVSYGCLTGPFTTGLKGEDGRDTGDGFHVGQIVKGPEGFFTDAHTVEFPVGAVRGQLG
ncbi:hypothetical protein EJ04DRAFT_501294 [Polyplosphaeria fusca]|uniref:CHRD domain-containing protein n=1 Tax=Polyplosphaeria fusca TaxID=682080 RepID=A0A9P4UZB1_9PLEO|nr:hypothetical protein EJ04DRAFT_501294 [Polyplosphaeria fusca]